MIKDVESSAAALIDGGWVPEDREEMIAEYELTEDDADVLIAEMKRMIEMNMEEE